MQCTHARCAVCSTPFEPEHTGKGTDETVNNAEEGDAAVYHSDAEEEETAVYHTDEEDVDATELLHIVCTQGDLATTTQVLSRNPNLIDGMVSQMTPLVAACAGLYRTIIDSQHIEAYNATLSKYSELIEYLVRFMTGRNTSVNTADANGLTALHYVMFVHEGLASLLLENGARGTTEGIFDHEMITPLAIACRRKYMTAVRLIYRGPVAHDVAERALIAACTVPENIDIVSFLLANDALTTGSMDEGYSLNNACTIGDTQVIYALVNKGADVNSVDINLKTPLTIYREQAAQLINGGVLGLLETKGAKTFAQLDESLQNACRAEAEDLLDTHSPASPVFVEM